MAKIPFYDLVCFAAQSVCSRNEGPERSFLTDQSMCSRCEGPDVENIKSDRAFLVVRLAAKRPSSRIEVQREDPTDGNFILTNLPRGTRNMLMERRT